MNALIPCPFDAVIFDLDGTLIDSHRDIVDCLAHAFRQVGIKPAVEIDLLADGSPLEEIYAVGSGGRLEDRFASFVAAYRSAYARKVSTSALFPGVHATLNRIAAMESGPVMAIATSKRSVIVHEILHALSIQSLFRMVIGSGDGTFRHKPEPDMLLHITKTLDIDPNRSLMVGDTLRDVRAAQRAGMAVAAVTYGACDVDRLLAARPEYVLDDFEQLLLLLGVTDSLS